jgi:hypothetical protein
LEQRTLLAAALPVVTIVATQPDCAEANRTTTGRGVCTASRTGSTAKQLIVKYAVNGNSTATDTVDFDHLEGLLTIPAGKKSAFIKITPVNDSIDEPTERIMISLKAKSTYTLGSKRNANLTIRDNDPPASTVGWWDTNRHFRAPITVDVGSFARTDQVVECSINFTTLLQQAGGSGSLIDDSIRVIETNADGTQVVDQNVPFQFDKDSGFNASSNASGNLVFILKGNTASGLARHFHVYFDTAGSFTPFSFTAQVTTTDNDSDEGQAAIKVDTQTATYWLQKQNGGFSSIEDKSGNDWLGFNPTAGTQSGGEFRGTPNAVYPGGGFHAGFNVGSTSIISQGPLKTTIECTMSVDKQIPGSPFTYKMRYEFYNDHVVATMVQAGSSYWFLYEGTPGGSVDGNDTVVRSDGTTTDISTNWNENSGIGSGNNEEWLYFRDSAVGKYMYFVHDQPDNLKDSYFRMDVNGSMTVFGFGRDNDAGGGDHLLMTAQNNRFTFGIADGGGSFGATSQAINGEYRPVTVTTGTAVRLT